MTILEIAITTLEEAIEAEKGGADSIEVSYDLARDGLTPEYDLVRSIRDAVSIDIHVIVRPHDRDFVYNKEELRRILSDTRQFVTMGITGIVFGAHKVDRTLDVEMIRQVVDAAQGYPVTLHRALDSCTNPEAALSQLVGVIPRVLTSGPAPSAWQGREGLRQWQRQFGTQFAFIAAGSITIDMLPELVNFTKVSGIHVGSAARMNGTVRAEAVRQIKSKLQRD